METFAELTARNSLKSTPFIVLLNKFDLFEENIISRPVNDYFPFYYGGADPLSACEYFASEFTRLDKRQDALLRIYRTSAVDQDSFRATMDSAAQWMS